MDRGKVIRTQEQMDAIPDYGRYRDVDGDGVAYRTLRVVDWHRYCTGGLAMMRMEYTQRIPMSTTKLWRDSRGRSMVQEMCCQHLLFVRKKREMGDIFYGSMENSIVEIDDMLEERGMSVSTCRVKALPYHSEVEDFIERHESCGRHGNKQRWAAIWNFEERASSASDFEALFCCIQ